MGGWVYSNTTSKPICGQELVIKVEGNLITISTQTESITFGLDGSQIGSSDSVYSSGGFGYICWTENLDIDMEIKSITI